MPFVPERLPERTHLRLERVFLFGVLGLVVIGLFTPNELFAGQVQDFANYVLFILAKILEWLLNTIGQLILLFVNVIIDVAQYNDFVNARPVAAGWPLVRDVVNMFFIVILLVTAFATIIQWHKFDYKKVLPKLLLMAVLVNFSKTLVGLLIDLSQVIMLTFVNGFKAAAAGNFVSVLKLDKVLQLATSREFSAEATTAINTSSPAAGQATVEETRDSLLLRIVMAEFLGMFIMGISLITLLFLLLYLLFRVVGLWVALILSPAALFASALDSTPLSKGVAFIAGNFWPRLGALLTGGPIMAFFLWLTLATVQTGGFGDIASLEDFGARQAEQGQSISYFASKVGTAEEVATFLVAIMLLLLGLDAALSIGNQVSSTLGTAGQRIRSAGLAATRFATYGALARAGQVGAGVGGRITGGIGNAGRAGVRWAGRTIDSRLGVTEGLGKGIQRFGTYIPIASVAEGVAARGAHIRGTGGRRRKEEQERAKKLTAEMGAGEKIATLDRLANAALNKDRAEAFRLEAAQEAVSKSGSKALEERFKKEGMEKHGYAEGSAALDAYAEDELAKETGRRFAAIKKHAKDTGDEKTVKFVDDYQAKRPDVLEDDDFKKEFGDQLAKGPRAVAQTVSPTAWQNSRLTDQLILESDLLGEGENGEAEMNLDGEAGRVLVKPGGDRARLIQHRFEELKAAAGGANASPEDIRALLAGGGAPPQRRYARSRTDRRQWEGFSQAQLGQGNASRGRARVREEPTIRAAHERLGELRRQMAATPRNERGTQVEDIRNTQYRGMMAGARASTLYGFNPQQGTFTQPEERTNFERNMQDFVRVASTNPHMYQSLDTEDLHARPNATNEMRSAAASVVDVGQLGQAWNRAAETAAQTHDYGSMEQIQSLTSAIHQEGGRVEARLTQYNQQHADAPIPAIALERAARANSQAALDAVVEAMPAGQRITMEEARALMHRTDINGHPELRYFQQTVSDRTHQAHARARRTGAGPAAGNAATPPPPRNPPPDAGSPPPPPRPPRA